MLDFDKFQHVQGTGQLCCWTSYHFLLFCFSETKDFVDTLFVALQNKVYLASASVVPIVSTTKIIPAVASRNNIFVDTTEPVVPQTQSVDSLELTGSGAIANVQVSKTSLEKEQDGDKENRRKISEVGYIVQLLLFPKKINMCLTMLEF